MAHGSARFLGNMVAALALAGAGLWLADWLARWLGWSPGIGCGLQQAVAPVAEALAPIVGTVGVLLLLFRSSRGLGLGLLGGTIALFLAPELFEPGGLWPCVP